MIESRIVSMLSTTFVATLLWLPSFSIAQTHDGQPLELSGYSVSESYDIPDNEPLDLEGAHVVKLLYRISQTGLDSLEKYSSYSQDVSWKQIIEETPEYRLWVFHRTGRVTSVAVMKLPDAAPDDPITHVYRCQCVNESGQAFEILSLSVPLAWNKAKSLDQPIEFFGFLFGLTDDNPLFIARNMLWRPTQPDPILGVSTSHVLLAEHGVDISGLDDVMKQNSKRMGQADKNAFFEMLDAVGSIPADHGLNPVSFTDLLTQPKENIGNAVALEGHVKKCSIVQLSDPQSKSKWGFDHYYQLILFPPIEGTIEVKNPNGENLTYRRFPATICVRELPAGLSVEEVEDKQIFVSGFYFRFWKYPSELTTQAGMSGQVSPLIIANQPVVIETDESTLNIFLESMALVILVVLAAVWWFARRSDLKTDAESLGLPDRIDLKGVEDQIE